MTTQPEHVLTLAMNTQKQLGLTILANSSHLPFPENRRRITTLFEHASVARLVYENRLISSEAVMSRV